jgi:pyruvate formate lyase activating enzyme
MRIGGMQRYSLLDYPHESAAIIFLQGCNFRCKYCHNPELVDPDRFSPMIDEEGVWQFLNSRIGKLQVVISGGEPLIHADIVPFISRIKEMGFKVKLDTNGMFPEVLGNLINQKLIDYVAMDIKAPFDEYVKVTGYKGSIEGLKKSLKLLIDGTIPYEFRSTLVPGIHTSESVDKMAQMVAGAREYYLQNFKSTKILDDAFKDTRSFPISEMREFLKIAQKHVPNTFLREDM